MNEELRILKIGSCPSLSGRSSLTFHIGCNSLKAIYLRISENTGRGYFSKDWIPLAQLETLLASEEKPITSGLRSLFRGKSVNSAGFIIATLIAEGLLKVSEDSLRSYERTDPTDFKKGIQVLMDTMDEKPPSKSAKVKVKRIPPEKPANPGQEVY